jgi:hypothetical protein
MTSRQSLFAQILKVSAIISGIFHNQIAGWWFEDAEVLEASRLGRLLTLDLDLGRACDLACPFCFAETQCPSTKGYVKRTVARAKQILDEAKALGCRSIKIVGAGEPFLFPGLLEVLEHCQTLGITPLIFTGGHVLGNDVKARKVYGQLGITSSLDLAQRIADLGASVIVKYLTFDPELQMSLVGNPNFDYATDRDQGIINLIKVGLNSSTPTRLGVDCLLLKSNINEAVELFGFWNSLNVFCVLNTSMECGRTESSRQNPEVVSADEALEAAVALYRYCLEQGIPFDKRISPYFCSPVCSQLNHGLFIGDNDDIKACPGGPSIGSYSTGKLAEIWEANPFRIKYTGEVQHHCISRCGLTYHSDFEEQVKEQLCI